MPVADSFIFYRYFVIANAIVTVYGFLVLFLPSKSQLWRLVVALDMVNMILYITFLYKCFCFGLYDLFGERSWQRTYKLSCS